MKIQVLVARAYNVQWQIKKKYPVGILVLGPRAHWKNIFLLINNIFTHLSAEAQLNVSGHKICHCTCGIREDFGVGVGRVHQGFALNPYMVFVITKLIKL